MVERVRWNGHQSGRAVGGPVLRAAVVLASACTVGMVSPQTGVAAEWVESAVPRGVGALGAPSQPKQKDPVEMTVTGSGRPSMVPGEIVTYSVELKNNDTKTDETTLTVDLPEQTEFVSLDGRHCGKASGHRVVCNYGTESGGTFGRPDITVKLKSSVPLGTKITARFVVDYKVNGQARQSAKTVVSKAVSGELDCNVVKDADAFPQARKNTYRALPSSASERERLQTLYAPPDVQPTGFCLRPGETVTVNVSGAQAGAKVELQVGAWSQADPYGRSAYGVYDYNGPDPRTYKLKPGANKISDVNGGILYVRYTHTTPAEASPLTVDFGNSKAVQPIPHYEYQKTTDAQWQKMLAAVGNGYVELVGPHIMVAALRESALRYQGEDQDALIDAYETVLKAEDDMSGFDASSPRDTRTPLRYLAVQTRSGANPNSGNNRVAIPSGSEEDMLSAAELANSWMMFHEFGHEHQQDWTWEGQIDTVNNIFSMAANDQFGHQTHGWADSSTWKAGQEYLAKSDRQFNKAGNKPAFVMFAQLRRAFGDGFYPELHRRMRAQKPDVGDTDKAMRWFTTTASEIAKVDLTDYFKNKWGLPLNKETLAALAALKLPKPATDPSTVVAFTGTLDDRTELVRVTNGTADQLELSGTPTIKGGTWAISPAKTIEPGRTAVIRATVPEKTDLEGTVTYTRPGAEGKASFTFRNPVASPNSYTVSTGKDVKVTTNDEKQRSRVTEAGKSDDTFSSKVLGEGNNPTIWVTVQKP